jgi:hypothetical protein
LRNAGIRQYWRNSDDKVPHPIGMMKFAQSRPAPGPLFNARARLRREGTAPVSVFTENELDAR